MAERQSTQHSPRLDDEMERETESLTRGSPVEARIEEWHQMEGPADGEPMPDAVVSVGEIELRSHLAISLRPSAFPGDRARLLAVAQEEHAEDVILRLLENLPSDETFPTLESAWEALGGQAEHRPNLEGSTVHALEGRTLHDDVAAAEAQPRQPELVVRSVQGVARIVPIAAEALTIVVGTGVRVASAVVDRMRRIF